MVGSVTSMLLYENDDSSSYLEHQYDYIKVPGNSGCHVEVIIKSIPVIKKTASSELYVPRLHLQRKKQQLYTNLEQVGIVVPRVLSYDEQSFTMEYLHMLDCIEFFERATPNIVRSRIDIIIRFIQLALINSSYKIVDKALFLNKLAEIKSKIPDFIWQRYYVLYEIIITNILRSQIIQIPCGLCHGDLTFSNIMFSIDEVQIGMIDFLDSFIESPIVDIIKLRQDTKFNWTSNRYPFAHDKGKIHIMNKWINGILNENFKNIINNNVDFALVEMMNYLRIAPYVNGTNNHEFLSEALSEISESFA